MNEHDEAVDKIRRFYCVRRGFLYKMKIGKYLRCKSPVICINGYVFTNRKIIKILEEGKA